ncbi:hypothetical protein L210DRAFT_3570863, partial [Boletus edulis BED1]
DLPWVLKSSTLRLKCFYPCPPCHRERSICLTWPAVQLGDRYGRRGSSNLGC